MPVDPLNEEKTKKRKKQKRSTLAPPSTQIEPITSVKTSLNPDYSMVSQTATIPHHTSTTQSLTNLEQISLDMNGTSSKPFNHLHQALDDQTPSSIVPKKQSKRHSARTKAPKQSRRRKTSKSRTRKERQSRSQPPSKKLLHLRPSQQASSQTKRSALRTPTSAYASEHLHSRTVSQQESLTSQDVLNPKHIKSKINRIESEIFLPPVFQSNPGHLSSSLYRMLSSTSSNFSSSISSSSSVGKDSMASHSQAWR